MPSVFISYSWEKNNKEWVAELAEQLKQDGMTVILDQWNLVPGDQLPQFMEKAIRDNDFVLIICTPHYKEKSDTREKGVGYEGDIINAERFVFRNERKFIPILKEGSWENAAPSAFLGKFYIDLSDSINFMRNYRTLIAALYGQDLSGLGIPNYDIENPSKFNLSFSSNLEKLVKNAETFLKLEDKEKAKNTFQQIVDNYPEDYRGWWGLARCETDEFTSHSIAHSNDLEIAITRTFKLANDYVLDDINSTYRDWCDSFWECESLRFETLPTFIPFYLEGKDNAEICNDYYPNQVMMQFGYYKSDCSFEYGKGEGLRHHWKYSLSKFIFVNGKLIVCEFSGHNMDSGYDYETDTRQKEFPYDLGIQNNIDNILIPLEVKKKSEGCYIATAIYGSYNAPEVLKLRQFRDKVLSKNLAGRLFIKLYYLISPKIANRLGNTTCISRIVKGALNQFVKII